MKFFAAFLLVFASAINLAFAQEPQAVIELPEMNMMYRGYDNKIKVLAADCNDEDIRLFCSNCSIDTTDTPGNYIVHPRSSKYAFIQFRKMNGDSMEVLRTVQYRVYNLPDPSLYWGAAKSGTKASHVSRLIIAKYPPSSPLYGNYEIESWMLTTDSVSVRGTGNSLNAADEAIKSIPPKTEVTIHVTVLMPDGTKRNLVGRWPF